MRLAFQSQPSGSPSITSTPAAASSSRIASERAKSFAARAPCGVRRGGLRSSSASIVAAAGRTRRSLAGQRRAGRARAPRRNRRAQRSRSAGDTRLSASISSSTGSARGRVEIVRHRRVELLAARHAARRLRPPAVARAQRVDRHHQPLEPRQRRRQILPGELQLAAVMRLEAHQPIGERVEARVDQRLERREVARRLRHLARRVRRGSCCASRCARRCPSQPQIRLVLRDLVGVVDLAVVDPAGVDVERDAEILCGSSPSIRGASPARRGPRASPIPSGAVSPGGRLAPDREVLRVALALDRLDPALAVVVAGAARGGRSRARSSMSK